MSGILAGDTLQQMNGRDYSSQGTLGCVGCGAVLQSGPGFAHQDGSLGGQMQVGPGRQFQEGSLGAVMQAGPGRQFREGSLGGGLGARVSPEYSCVAQSRQRYGERRARCGASMLSCQRSAMAAYRAEVAACAGRRPATSGLGLIDLSSELLIGLGVGALGTWLVLRKR